MESLMTRNFKAYYDIYYPQTSSHRIRIKVVFGLYNS